jgi:hypothetical protein
VSPANERTTTPNVADAAYIEGPNTDMLGVASLAVDTVDNRLWVLVTNTNAAVLPPITDANLFGTQEYLLAFDLREFSGAPGPHNIAPVAAYGGGRFAAPPSANLPTFANSLTAGGGRVYVANSAGPTPCRDRNCPPPGQSGFNDGPEGEVDVYDGAASGFHVGVPAGMPSTVLYGYTVKAPVAVAFGPRGSVLSVDTKIRGMAKSNGLTPRARELLEALRARRNRGDSSRP